MRGALVLPRPPLRPLVVGMSLLALISGLAPAAVAETIENPALIFGSVPWEFSTRTNTFSSGEDAGFTLRAKFDDEGNFRTGTFQYRASDNRLLLQSNLFEPSLEAVPDGDTGVNAFYRIRFGLDIHHDDLPFLVDGGVFEAYVCDPRSGCGSGPTSLEDVFTTDYTGASAPVNNYLFTWHDQGPAASLLLAAVPVSAPAPGVLLGLGMVVILVAMRLRRGLRVPDKS